MINRFANNAALLITLATLMWGANAVAGQLTVGHISPLSVVFFRWVIVSIVMWIGFGHEVRKHWPLLRPKLAVIALMAALGFTGFNALFYAAAHSTSGVNVGILQGSVPVFVLAGARIWYGTAIRRGQIIGVLIASLGVVAVASRGMLDTLIQLQLNPGDALMLLACALYAGYTIALQKRPAVPGRTFFTLMAPIAGLTALPLWIAEIGTGYFIWPSVQGWLVTLFIAIFPSCLAQLMFLRGVDLVGPGRAGAYVNLVPVFASLLAVAILGESFASYHAIGLSLVIGGIWLTQRQST